MVRYQELFMDDWAIHNDAADNCSGQEDHSIPITLDQLKNLPGRHRPRWHHFTTFLGLPVS